MSASDFHLLTSDDWSDYQLIDSGDMRKLERFGKVRVNRPDPQALWKPNAPVSTWKVDATFAPTKDDDDERGAWSFTGKAAAGRMAHRLERPEAQRPPRRLPPHGRLPRTLRPLALGHGASRWPPNARSRRSTSSATPA